MSIVRSTFFLLCCLLLVPLLVGPSQAVTTDLTIHVISKGAKFVGTSMMGARITIKDAQTGELLAEGTTEGSTGNTTRIMKEAHKRGAALSTPDAAEFKASLDLQKARKIKITAYGPRAQQQAANSVSMTQWVLPGRDISRGDALLLELPGFVVDILQPPAHVSLKGSPRTVTVHANVTMMCGCPIAPGGLWDAEQYEITAELLRKGELLETVDLNYAGTASQFEGDVPIEEPGTYELRVYAFDPSNGNTGVDWTTVSVSK